MNIKDAKEQIKNAMIAYFTKDENGYVVPIERQRPIFLVGAPGIGKTAIMEQVASEMGLGLLSYSMTHHTRQSALGLPFIEQKNYGGIEYSVSEYTMSEIIASVYDMIEETGVKEGILFLDEINCVSETLSPIMLQFLQYKIFGKHRVPSGWIVVTAGNPPEYNNSVKEFDTVTWDRLKRIDIEPDFNVWKEYAYNKNIHPSIITYLEIKKRNFYSIETTVEGKSFVTARGWDDLSQMIKLYEKQDIIVDEKLVSQYLQNRKIAKDFSIYYDLFKKYKSDYKIDTIFTGEADNKVKNRAIKAKFDERLAFLGLLIDYVNEETEKIIYNDKINKDLSSFYRKITKALEGSNETPYNIFGKMIVDKYSDNEKGKQANSVSREDYIANKRTLKRLDDMKEKLFNIEGKEEFLKLLKNEISKSTKNDNKEAAKFKTMLSNMFKFCEEVFEGGQEMLILVTELTLSKNVTRFIITYGCDEYFKYSKDLLLYDRQKEIINKIEELE